MFNQIVSSGIRCDRNQHHLHGQFYIQADDAMKNWTTFDLMNKIRWSLIFTAKFNICTLFTVDEIGSNFFASKTIESACRKLTNNDCISKWFLNSDNFSNINIALSNVVSSKLCILFYFQHVCYVSELIVWSKIKFRGKYLEFGFAIDTCSLAAISFAIFFCLFGTSISSVMRKLCHAKWAVSCDDFCTLISWYVQIAGATLFHMIVIDVSETIHVTCIGLMRFIFPQLFHWTDLIIHKISKKILW